MSNRQKIALMTRDALALLNSSDPFDRETGEYILQEAEKLSREDEPNRLRGFESRLDDENVKDYL